MDIYHRGHYAGFGSRHGVNHWSDHDKEWRVSMPLVRRLHYYMTADPWTREAILNTVAIFQSHTRTVGTAPSTTSTMAGVMVKYELGHDEADRKTLENFADLYSRAFREDGQLIARVHIDGATGIGELVGEEVHQGLFFLNTFGGQHGLIELADLLGHQPLHDALVRYARVWIKDDDSAPLKGFLAQPSVLAFLAHAYRQTGEKRFQQVIAATVKEKQFQTHDLGGKTILDDAPHSAIDGRRVNKHMCHYLGDKLHLIPFGLPALQAPPPPHPPPAQTIEAPATQAVTERELTPEHGDGKKDGEIGRWGVGVHSPHRPTSPAPHRLPPVLRPEVPTRRIGGERIMAGFSGSVL